ncbi:DUF3077 domain-containing protein [Pseudomonas tussilaginis]|uniref:DUF3077 domain-containing protein n=1 Tax=Pseudomonas putida TaxID=303 RepID=UPI002364785F|nr:DUF3077 domain-containing protein [Pseudomonas putida]MDD1975596.1 DUF3077 domain-containing protein [Pseudomonas putida]
MSTNSSAKTDETVGIASFIQSQEPAIDLFRISPGVPCDYALEEASTLLGCVHKLILIGVTDKDEDTILAAYYLSGFAKAIIDDVGLAMTKS